VIAGEMIVREMIRRYRTLLRGLLAAAAIAICGAPATAQKQIDIGAAEAPLSDQERVDLDQAVRKHNYAAEKAVIGRALDEHPDSYELLIMAGRLAYLEKQPKDAAAALARADKIKPVAEGDRMTLALALSFTDNLKSARAEFQKLIAVSPKNAEYLFLLGRVDANGRHFEDAAADFGKAIALDPNMVKAYEDLGRAQENLGNPEDARKTYEAGALHNRQNKSHWEWSPLDLGVVLLKDGDLNGAEALFREALLYNPRSGPAHYNMGQVFQKKGDEARAMDAYKEAVVDEPRLRQAWLALGRQFTRQGNKVEADRALGIFKALEDEDNARKGRKN